MFRRNEKNFFRLLTEQYFEAGFRATEIMEVADYKDVMRRIKKMEDQIMEKYPDAHDDLDKMLELYGSMNEVKDQYLFEDGVMLGFQMLLPQMTAEKSAGIGADADRNQSQIL